MTAFSAPLIDKVIAEERFQLDQTVGNVIRLAEINSGTANIAGTRAVQTNLAKQFSQLGAQAAVSQSDVGTHIDDHGESQPIEYGPILRASIRPEEANRVLVLGHADTVFGRDSPFQDVRKDGSILRGPGVTDMKGGLVLLIRALEAIERHSLAPGLGIDVLVNSDEEVGSLGSATALDTAAREATAGVALVLEPRLPDGTHAGSRPASSNISIVVTGRAAHAGRALAEGRNAVVAGAELSVVISALTESRPRLGVNVAAMRGGGPLNAVPHVCVVRVNLRSPRTEDLEWALGEIDRFAAMISADREVVAVRHGGIHRPAKPWTPSSTALGELVTAVNSAVGLPSGFTDTGGVCDGNNASAAGLAVVDTLGVSGAGIHTDEEHTPTKTWPEHVALLTILLHELATNRLVTT